MKVLMVVMVSCLVAVQSKPFIEPGLGGVGMGMGVGPGVGLGGVGMGGVGMGGVGGVGLGGVGGVGLGGVGMGGVGMGGVGLGRVGLGGVGGANSQMGYDRMGGSSGLGNSQYGQFGGSRINDYDRQNQNFRRIEEGSSSRDAGINRGMQYGGGAGSGQAFNNFGNERSNYGAGQYYGGLM